MALDERLRRDLEHAARPADPTGVYEQLIRRHERRLVVRRLQRGGLAFVVVVGTIAGIYGLSRVFLPGGGGPGVEVTPIPITAENGLIAYVRDSELHTMEPDGSADRVIASPSSQVRSQVRFAEWSPDGSRLAVVTMVPDTGVHSLWTMNADGSGATELASAMVVTSASWSPDGSTIAYAALPLDGRLAEIHLVSTDGGNDRVVYDEPDSGRFPLDVVRFSPDGGTILFDEVVVDDQGKGVSMRILEMDAGGGGVRPFTSLELAQQPSWSPDGLWVAVAKLEPVEGDDGSSASWNIFVVDADGSGPRRLTEGGTQNDRPHWSPDGTKIAYLNHASERIVVVNPDGSDPVELPPTGVSALSWQPIPAGTPSNAPTPTETTDPTQGIGLGFPVCNVSSLTASFVAPGADATVYVATKKSDVGGCPNPEETTNVIAIDVDGDGVADSSYGPITCAYECRPFSAPDLDGDGTAELLVLQLGGAVVDLYLYDVSKDADGVAISPVSVAGPGDPEAGFDPGEQAVFWLGGDAFELYTLRCGNVRAPDGPGIVATLAEALPHDSPDARWHAHQVTFVVREGALALVDTTDFVDPMGAEPSFGSGETLCGSNLGP